MIKKYEPLKNKIKLYPKWIEKQIEEENLIKFEKINPDNPPLLKETVYVTKIYLLLIKKFRNDIKQAVEGLKKEITKFQTQNPAFDTWVYSEVMKLIDKWFE